MKNKGMTIAGLMGVMFGCGIWMLIILLSVAASKKQGFKAPQMTATAEASTSAEAQPKPKPMPYVIEVLGPEVIRVVAVRSKYSYTCGDALAEGVKSVEENFFVKQIATVERLTYQGGSVTSELFLIVEPKEKKQ